MIAGRGQGYTGTFRNSKSPNKHPEACGDHHRVIAIHALNDAVATVQCVAIAESEMPLMPH